MARSEWTRPPAEVPEPAQPKRVRKDQAMAFLAQLSRHLHQGEEWHGLDRRLTEMLMECVIEYVSAAVPPNVGFNVIMLIASTKKDDPDPGISFDMMSTWPDRATLIEVLKSWIADREREGV